YYAERFRGNDELADRSRKRIESANKVADLLVGWSQMALGHEPHYKDLRRFLDNDFRADLQNLSLYWWFGQISTAYDAQANQEFIVRLGQYLLERGYFKAQQLPQLYRIAMENDRKTLLLIVQRLVASKLGLP